VLCTGLPGHAIPSKQREIRVLFVGNSYTYFNNLPEMFAKLAETGHQAKVVTRMEAPGGWRLKDHWEKGAALKALHEDKWNYVVLQEQSTLGMNYFLDGRPRVPGDELFSPYARKWAAEIRRTGAVPVFYLTWARKATPEDQAALNYFYLRAARENRALVAPVGIAWAQVRREQPEFELYFADGSHPSPAGSYLAACELYATLFEQDPAGLPGKIEGAPVNLSTAKAEPGRAAVLADIPMERVRPIQNAAWTAWQRLKADGGSLADAPPAAPSLPPLPAGSQLSSKGLQGTWSGNLLLYPPPFLPLEMVLHLSSEGANLNGRLELLFHSKDQPDRSFDLPDLSLTERELTFTDPRGLQNLKVSFRAVSVQPDELRGIAEAAGGKADSFIRLQGTWRLHKN
jgi:hypothetical protein